MVHMRTVNSAATPDRENGMGHLRAYRVAAGGKLHGNKADGIRAELSAATRRLTFAAVTLFAASIFSSAGHAQSGPFAGMAGNWSGSGTVTLDDGSSERIRCRASYAVSENGNGLNQTLTCASDSYKFDLRSNVIAENGSLSGTWSESSRGVSGNLQGHSAGGNFQVIASAPGFTANISLTTRGNRQSVVIKSDSVFRGAAISMSRI
jgi:hypothetical protein